MGAQVATLGWRILPIPMFFGAHELWRNRDDSNGNRACIDFDSSREWLVIPPDSSELPATKVEGRIRAIRWAYERATAGRAGTP